MSFSAVFAAIRSRTGLVLLVPAVLLAGAAVVVGKSGPVRAPVADSDQAPPQRKAIEAIVKDYLLENPEIMLEVQAALQVKMEKVQAEKTAAALKIYAGEIFRPAFSPIVGNPKGDVTIVEFFDYNCGFCKKALTDVAKLIEREKQVKVVLKELPILAKGSEEAARVALAAKMQGKYWAFHQAMLTASGQANEASALRVAEKIGLDMPKLKTDMASAEVAKEIDDTRALAEKLQIQGTPFFMIADRAIPGAPTDLLEQMTRHVAEVRKQGGCKIC